jgi:protein SCO1/2
MLKNKSYIGISLIILLFGIYAIPKIIDRIQNGAVVKGERLDGVTSDQVTDKLKKLDQLHNSN